MASLSSSPSRASISEAMKSRLTHGGEIYSVRQINNDLYLLTDDTDAADLTAKSVYCLNAISHIG